MQQTVYDKLRVLKDAVLQKLGIKEEKKLFQILGKLATWHYPKKRRKDMTLSKEEAMVYELLITNNYNPSTCYKWMLACNTSEEIRKKLKNGEIGLKSALRSRPYKNLSQVESEFLYQVKLAIQKYVVR